MSASRRQSMHIIKYNKAHVKMIVQELNRHTEIVNEKKINEYI